MLLARVGRECKPTLLSFLPPPLCFHRPHFNTPSQMETAARIEAASGFILQSPPGEINDVLNGVHLDCLHLNCLLTRVPFRRP